jgi:hypothetical protein
MLRYLLIPLALLLGLTAFNFVLAWLAIISLNRQARPLRYNTRGLLIAMTVASVLLGIAGAAIRLSQ